MAIQRPSAGRLRALVFDVDGTLYDQGRVRAAMLLRLLAFAAAQPSAGVTLVRILREYRRAQEWLRDLEHGYADLGAAQEQEAARRAGVTREQVRACVARWMEQEPLDLLDGARRDGLFELLAAGRRRGLRLAICSDYPAQAKLEALRLSSFFDVVVCAQDADVQRFKPDPRGLLVAAARLGVTPQQVLYIGDRPEVDAAAATRAGAASVIVAHRVARRGAHIARYSCHALADALEREVL